MHDPILEEIWRVREELLKKHGGLEGYLKYVQKVDRAQRKRKRRPENGAPRRRRAKKTP
jgi:hypothetical protein